MDQHHGPLRDRGDEVASQGFKFDFFSHEDEDQAKESYKEPLQTKALIPAELLEITDRTLEQAAKWCSEKSLDVNVGGSIGQLRLVQTTNTKLAESSSAAAVTDVEPDVYEGGFKIWECALDVARILSEQGEQSSTTRVLDLGCGHGVPGIVAARLGATVLFQDLNKEVLLRQTCKNVERNLGRAAVEMHAFVSGDWRELGPNTMGVSLFDLIVSAETVYAIELFDTLHGVLERWLAPLGRALIAGKRYYFGVGGGTTSFEQYILGRGVFDVKVLASYNDGSSNIRDVLELRKKRSTVT